MTRGSMAFIAWSCFAAAKLSTSPVEAASVDEASKAQLKAATESYERGVEAMDAEKYAEALDHFRRSYDTVGSPNSRMMVGRALVKLGRLPDAYRELTLTIREASELATTQKKYKKTVETAQKELAEIQGKLAYVSIKPSATVQLEGQTLPLESWKEPQPVMPGAVAVTMTSSDGRSVTKQLTLSPGEKAEVALEGAAPPAPPAKAAPDPALQAPSKGSHGATMSRKTVGYVFGAVGIVGVGTFVGFGLVGASGKGDTKANCGLGVCPETSVDDASSKGLFQGIGYTGLAIGVLGLGAGTWLVLSSGGSGSARSTSLQVGPRSVLLEQRF